MRRLAPHLFGAALLALVLEPILHAAPRDDFPFSTYPMFSGRLQRTVSLGHVVAVTRGAPDVPVPPRYLGTDEVLQARATIAHASDRGTQPARALCQAVAARVAESGGPLAGADALEVRTDTYDVIAYFEGKREPTASRRHARCRLSGPAAKPRPTAAERSE